MNENLAMQKGLIKDGNKDMYVSYQNVYKYLFEQYLKTKTDLEHYNNLIKNSPLDFGKPHPHKSEIPTNLNKYSNLEYVYLVNNFFIEKLSIDDLKLLSKYNDENFKEQIQNMIIRTYKEVIKDNWFNGAYTNDKYKVFYGESIPDNAAYNDNLVIKIMYSRNKKSMEEEEFIKNMEDKKIYLNQIIKNIETEIKNKLDLECFVIVEKIYN